MPQYLPQRQTAVWNVWHVSLSFASTHFFFFLKDRTEFASYVISTEPKRVKHVLGALIIIFFLSFSLFVLFFVSFTRYFFLSVDLVNTWTAKFVHKVCAFLSTTHRRHCTCCCKCWRDLFSFNFFFRLSSIEPRGKDYDVLFTFIREFEPQRVWWCECTHARFASN